jgi:hypothetical protein
MDRFRLSSELPRPDVLEVPKGDTRDREQTGARHTPSPAPICRSALPPTIRIGHPVRVSDSPRPIPSMGATGEPRPEFIGLRRDEAEDRARAEGLTTRVLELPLTGPAAWHADGRPDRLNLIVEDGRVIRATVV